MLVAAICFKVEKSKNYFVTKMDEVHQQLYIINATKILIYYVLWLDSSSTGKYNEMRLAGGTYIGSSFGDEYRFFKTTSSNMTYCFKGFDNKNKFSKCSYSHDIIATSSCRHT